MNYLSLIILVLYILVSPGTMEAQVKSEREYRLAKEKVPLEARRFIASLEKPVRLRWYMEESPSGYSVEAKFRLNGKRYSVEFDTSGALQDVEFIINPSSIPPSSMALLTRELDSLFKHHHFVKIQQHYQGPADLQLLAMQKNIHQDGLITRYEIVIRGKRNGTPALFEVTTGQDGKVLDVLIILSKSAEHLEY
ncbi:MAG: hypothetical protein IH599_05040 [Bacteroidales bacterium]|nr:hypothetical protein [Bacteroidales bacterium]